MKYALLLPWLLMSLLTAKAQEEAPFAFKKRLGLAIKEETLAILTGKTWTTYKQYKVSGQNAQLQAGNFFSLRINADRTFLLSGGNARQNGRWNAKSKALEFEVTEYVYPPGSSAPILSGVFAIYKITNDEMLLAALPDHHWIYYLRGSKPQSVDANAAPASNFQERERQGLLREIETEFFLRKLRTPSNLNTMPIADLYALRNRLVQGRHTKEAILRDELKMELSARTLPLPADFDRMNYKQLRQLQRQILKNKYSPK